MEGFVYILKFKKNGKYYIGSTNNLGRRLFEHKNNQTKYTSQNGGFELVFSQKFDNIVVARQMEQKIKKQKSRKIIEMIIKDKFIKTHS